jgi:hypothetical protein
MARSFSSARIEYGTTVPSPANCTIAAWIRTGTLGGTRSIVDRDDGTNRYFQFRTSGTALQFIGFSGNSPATASGGTLSNSTVYHVAGRADGSTVKCYVAGSEVGSASLGAMDNDTVRFNLGNGAGAWNGDIAEVAQWSVALTTDEIAALAKGLSPLLVRPTALQFYAPVIGRYSSEPAIVGGYTGTIFGTATVADHPRIIYPESPRVLPLIAAGAPPAAAVAHYYRHLLRQQRGF